MGCLYPTTCGGKHRNDVGGGPEDERSWWQLTTKRVHHQHDQPPNLFAWTHCYRFQPLYLSQNEIYQLIRDQFISQIFISLGFWGFGVIEF